MPASHFLDSGLSLTWEKVAPGTGTSGRSIRLTAVGVGQFLSFYKHFRSYLHAVEVFSGGLLLFVGGLIFMNKLTWLSGKLWFLNRFSL